MTLTPEQAQSLEDLIVKVEIEARHAGLRGDRSSEYGPALNRALKFLRALSTTQPPAYDEARELREFSAWHHEAFGWSEADPDDHPESQTRWDAWQAARARK
jgi:hypothetical protein